MQKDKGVLSAKTDEGDINLFSKNYADIKNAKLEITAITGNGIASITSDATMISGGNTIDVKGNRIDLTSNYGSIGSHESQLKINAGQEPIEIDNPRSASVNAYASGDIALNQTEGDMRLGKIISTDGDVYLTSEGSILDALPKVESESQSADLLIKKWEDLGIIRSDGNDNSEEKRTYAITTYETSIKTAYNRYLRLKERFDDNKDNINNDTYKEYQILKQKYDGYGSADEWLEAQDKDQNSDYYILKYNTSYGWTRDQLLYAIQSSILNREEGSTIVSPDDANISARNVYINAGRGIGLDDGYTVVEISKIRDGSDKNLLKEIASAEASDVKWGFNGNEINDNYATISKINSLKINANGNLKAEAKGNIYFEDVNDNSINLISVSSKDGNVRIFGNKGIYNATKYNEGSENNIINISGKDLILDAGKGSIGKIDIPITTNMFGSVTARSNGPINIYQLGNNALTFASAYSGSYINIRALKDILSVYTGIQAEELGYINAKGDITLYSEQGDIGQSNGKFLRVKLAEGKTINAEAESVYLKLFNDTNLDLGKITARSGNIGIDSEELDLILNDDISGKNLEFHLRSLTQKNGSIYAGNLLKVIADNGILLNYYTEDNDKNYIFYNNIAQASLVNNKSGDIMLYNNGDLNLYTAKNKADDGIFRILNKGSVTAKNGLSSNGRLFIWATGDINIDNDTSSKDWMGLYANNGGVKAKSLKADNIDIKADKNGFSANNITANGYIKANIDSGDINTADVIAKNGDLVLITNNGNLTSNVLKAKNDITVHAINGELKAYSIKNESGDIEVFGDKLINVENVINAGHRVYLKSLGDILIESIVSKDIGSVIYPKSKLLDISLLEDFKNNFNILIGNNIRVNKINVGNSLYSSANGNFDSAEIISGKKAYINANNNININSVNTGHDLTINSYSNEGSINIENAVSRKGEMSISNKVGDINLVNVDAGGNFSLKNDKKGNIDIASITTRLGGSLFIDLNDGDLNVKSGYIDGKASIYSEKGNILLSSIEVGDELDLRAKNGGIGVGIDENDNAVKLTTKIGGDATFKSDSDRVVLADAEVGGNMKISAKTYSYIHNAAVKGSMLLKGDITGCHADSLNVGENLIINTQTGSVEVKEASVGKHAYISIDENGGNINIENIETGKNDSTGSLVVVSNSLNDENKTSEINITQATAAFKLIINSLSNVNLNKAFALNGLLEVKAIGDIVAETLKAAKNTFIASLIGQININKVISGGLIQVYNILGNKIKIDHLETLDPDADISIAGLACGLEISNATATKDITFKTINGNVYIDNVNAGNDINIGGYVKDNITIENTSAGHDIILRAHSGNINISNTHIGNNLTASLDGKMDVKDVEVINNTNITSKNDSSIYLNRFKTGSFNLKDNGNTSANIAYSELGSSNIDIAGKFNLTNSTVNDLKAVLKGESSIEESKFDKAEITNEGSLLIKAFNGNYLKTINNNNLTLNDEIIESFDLTSKGITNINDSEIKSLTADNSGSLSVNNLTNEKFDLINSGIANINNTKINNVSGSNNGDLSLLDSTFDIIDYTNNREMNLSNDEINNLNLVGKGNLSIEKSVIQDMNVNIGGYANIANSSIEKMNAEVKGDTTINNVVNSEFTANIGGKAEINKLTDNKSSKLTVGKNTYISDSEIVNLDAKVGGDLKVNTLSNNQINANVSGKADINNLTSDEVTAQIGKDAYIKDSNIAKLNAEIKGNSEIKNVENSELTADISGKAEIEKLIGNKSTKLTVGKDASIKDSNIAKLNAEIKGDTTINNVVNSDLTANISGKAEINKLTDNKSSKLIVGKDTLIADSEINNLEAKVGGDLTANTLANKLMNAKVSGNADITNFTSDEVTAQIGKDALIKDSTIAKFNAEIKGNSEIKNVENSELTADISGKAEIEKLIGNKSTKLTVGKDATIKDSRMDKIDAKVTGNATVNNLANSQLTANISGNATIDKLNGNKSTNLTVGKDVKLTNSSINTLTASVKGNASIDNLTNNSTSKLTVGKNATISDSAIASITAEIGGNATINNLTGNKTAKLTVAKDTSIADSEINNLNAKVGGDLTVNNLSNSQMSAVVDGKAYIDSLKANKSTTLTAKGGADISNSNIDSLKASVGGSSLVKDSVFKSIDLINNGEAVIKDSTVNTIVASNSNKLTITDIKSTIDKLTLNNSGESIINNNKVNNMISDNSGELSINKVTGNTLKLTSSGKTNISGSNIKSINANNSGELDVNSLTSDNLELTSKGTAKIAESDIKTIKANISGTLDANKLTSNKLELTSNGYSNIVDSTITNINANVSGKSTIKNLTNSQMSLVNSGNTNISNSSSANIKLTNSGETVLDNIDVTGSAYFVNRNGSMNIDQLDVANNFDLDSNGGNINLSGIDITNDFNFALKGNSGVKFTDITIGNDFNVYAGKAVLNGSSLNVGHDMNTYKYSKYSAPKSSVRAAVKSNSGTAKSSEREEGFTLILDELNIGGGLYVDNPDVTIQVKESTVGHDVNIDAGKEKIQIDKLDVDGGSLDIKGDSGAIKLGDVNVDNETSVKLGNGNLEVASLTSTLGVDFNVGGSISSTNLIRSENSSVNAVAGGNLTASAVEAKNNIDLNIGGNIISDNKIETETESVNMIAGGGVNAYKVLAKQQGNIEAVNGDIIIGQINGKTLVLKEDTNNRSLSVDEANVENKISIAADYIDFDVINQTANEERLGVDFNLVNGKAMDNVVIKDIKTDTGVNMNNLVSMYGDIHVSNDIFNLTRTYLLKKGDLSNTKLKFRLFGDNPSYSKEPDIIAFFAPKVNHKNYADISFTNEWHVEKQDYYPLTAKHDYKRMFNQYTVVQEFETLRLAFEDRIKELNDDFSSKLDYLKLDYYKPFYFGDSSIFIDSESVNLNDVDIPVGIEFDSVNGELKSSGSYVKSQRAVD